MRMNPDQWLEDVNAQNHDLRTIAGRRAEILHEISEYGGFTVFWITENRLRASVAQEMQDKGEIITDNRSAFPWINSKIADK